MNEQFNKYNIENYRISAITPKDFDNVLEQKRPLTCKHPGCTSCEYEYGCLCSHIKAMKECLKYNDSHYVIIEDDIFLPFKINYNELKKNIPEEFDIIQLLILYDKTIDVLKDYYISNNSLFIKWQYLLPSTGMYIISKKGAQKMIDLYVNKNNKYDFSSSNCQNVADVLIYSSIPTVATTLPYCYPNIEMGSEIHPHHLDEHKKAIKSIKNAINTVKNYPFIDTLI